MTSIKYKALQKMFQIKFVAHIEIFWVVQKMLLTNGKYEWLCGFKWNSYKYMYIERFIQFSLCRKLFSILNVKNGHFYIHIIHLLKVVNATTVESTEWAPDSPELNLLNYHIWNEVKQVGYKIQIEPFKSCDLVFLTKNRKCVASHITR
jgi:hypothetical protein